MVRVDTNIEYVFEGAWLAALIPGIRSILRVPSPI
jgi:hypothetical protein